MRSIGSDSEGGTQAGSLFWVVGGGSLGGALSVTQSCQYIIIMLSEPPAGQLSLLAPAGTGPAQLRDY